MPDDLRWSWYNNNGNKVHNKYNVLESSPNQLQPLCPQSMEKLPSMKLVPGTKKVGDHWITLFIIDTDIQNLPPTWPYSCCSSKTFIFPTVQISSSMNSTDHFSTPWICTFCSHSPECLPTRPPPAFLKCQTNSYSSFKTQFKIHLLDETFSKILMWN